MQLAPQIIRNSNVYTNLSVDSAAAVTSGPTQSPVNTTVVLLHGYGANGRDLIPCASFFQKAREWNWVFPEASIDLGGMGFSGAKAWFDLDVAQFQAAAMGGGGIQFDRKTLAAASSCALKVQKILEELKLDPKRTVVGGFSQGAMLALMVALAMPVSPMGVLLFSCADVFGEENFAALLKGDKKLPPIFQSHGRNDAVLGFSSGEAVRERLLGAGFDVDFREFRGGHEIPPQVLQSADRAVKGWGG